MSSVILLAGGLGARLQGLHPEVPKPMIPVAGRPFLEWAIQYWERQGVRRVILSLGHLAVIAEAHFEERICGGVRVEMVREPRSMGTGGAVRFAALASVPSDPFFVANGDSLVLADVSAALLLMQDPSVDAVVLGVTLEDASRYGSLDVDADGTLRSFREKEAGTGLINAGIYLFRQRTLDLFPLKTPLSLETEVFPALLERGSRIVVHRCAGPFLDMGTPEDLKRMGEFIKSHFPRGKRENPTRG
jgi:D-glycero-alpha-D-manno-heptose 1-phosphate guanylyltransferase